MPSLPSEIWLQIIEWIQPDALASEPFDRTTLKHLSLVSPTLRHLTQPELFRYLPIDIYSYDSKVEARLKGLVALFKIRPETSRWIKSFSCTDWNRHPTKRRRPNLNRGDTHRSTLCTLITSIFVQSSALTTIRIAHIPITLEIISHIHRLSNLRSFDIDCQDSPGSNDVWAESSSQALPPFPEDGETPRPVFDGLASVPGLRSLTINGPSAVIFILDIAQSYSSFNFINLTSLTLSDMFNPTINSPFDFPALFPNLTHLTISRLARPWVNPAAPSPSALKKLRYFDGHYASAIVLLPGRPIDDLVVTGEQYPHALSLEALSPLGAGSMKLRRLGIENCFWSEDCFAVIGELFPELEHLSLECIHDDYLDWVEKRLPDEIRRLPLLRSLHLAPAYYQTTQEPAYESILSIVGASAPSLREVRFDHIMWKANDHGHWAFNY